MLRAAGFLRDSRRADHLWHEFETPAGLSSEWVTGFVCATAGHSGLLRDVVLDAVKALVRRQRPNGGWGFNPTVPADCDSTAWCLLAIAAGPPWRPSAIARGLRYLQMHQHTSGGFATYVPSDGIDGFIGASGLDVVRGWMSPHACVTGVTLEALTVHRVRGYEATISTGCSYLERERGEDALWRSYWWDGPAYATLFALRALTYAGASNRRMFDDATAGLLNRRLPNGSWSVDSASGDAFTTAISTLAVLFGGGRRGLDAARRSAEWLTEHQDDDGGWASVPILRITPPPVVSPDTVGEWRVDELGTGVIIRDEGRVFTTAAAVWALSAVDEIEQALR